MVVSMSCAVLTKFNSSLSNQHLWSQNGLPSYILSSKGKNDLIIVKLLQNGVLLVNWRCLCIVLIYTLFFEMPQWNKSDVKILQITAFLRIGINPLSKNRWKCNLVTLTDSQIIRAVLLRAAQIVVAPNWNAFSDWRKMSCVPLVKTR